MPVNPVNSLNDSVADVRGGDIQLSVLNDSTSGGGQGGGGSAQANVISPTKTPPLPNTVVDPVTTKALTKGRPDRSRFLSMNTNFRTMKYSGDQPDNGTSPQPYIRTSLARSFTQAAPQTYEENSGLKGIALFSAIDQDRINKFLKTNQKGKLFADKQRELAFFNPKTEVGLNYAYTMDNTLGVLDKLIPGAGKAGGIEFTRTYNDNLNLLQQVGVQGTGLHFDAPGSQPVIPFQNKYEYVVRSKDKETNRLVLLFNNKIVDNSFKNLITTPNLADMNKTGIARGQNKIFEYLGGPGASDANGLTVIGRYTYTTDWKSFSAYTDKYIYSANVQVDKESNALVKLVSTTRTIDNVVRKLVSPPVFNPVKEDVSLSHKYYSDPVIRDKAQYDSIIARGDLTSGSYGDATWITPLTPVPGEPSANIYAQQYERNKNIVRGLGRPGSNRLKKVDYHKVGYQGADEGVDLVNFTDVIRDGEVAKAPDYIKCVFRAVETSTSAKNEAIMVFRAFISNFADNYNASYGEHTYVGRGEKFYTYQVADRKISFQLAIAAQSRAEMKPLYRKLNYLVSQMYPTYQGLTNVAAGTGFMRSPLVKVTIGDYIYNQPGFFTSMQISVPNESIWETESANTEDVGGTDMYQLPHYLILNLQFTPIHNFIPRRASAEANNTYSIPTFITPNENKANNKNLFELG